MDGLLDWYLLGVVIGLGVAAGAAAFRRLASVGSGLALAGGVVLVLLALPSWALGALAAAALLAWFFLRHLSVQAVPAAFLGAAALAFVPLAGYALAALLPVAAGRLGRRAESRYAGLRILARD